LLVFERMSMSPASPDSKYLVMVWIRAMGGSPGSGVETRPLTGT